MAVEVTMRGPVVWDLSETQLERAVEDTLDDAVMDVAKAVHSRWDAHMKADFKHPRPYYWTRVHTEKRPHGAVAVTDGFVIYGPWLEGVARRNHSTRFKGYAGARRTMQEMGRRVPVIVVDAVDRGIGRLS